MISLLSEANNVYLSVLIKLTTTCFLVLQEDYKASEQTMSGLKDGNMKQLEEIHGEVTRTVRTDAW